VALVEIPEQFALLEKLSDKEPKIKPALSSAVRTFFASGQVVGVRVLSCFESTAVILFEKSRADQHGKQFVMWGRIK
jgi:hypothetical protein